ncbi:hypothetical protein QJS10_CPB20g01361 [Acorus calamus]|uniref:Uncharacterized protein n=1 Tax=Acorus calamus TaxID=4465 RepID=A0AAV9CDG6_ACOCL|nr:hypothetical protein QJS10_CPB20g01361 [Acorus calamus]
MTDGPGEGRSKWDLCRSVDELRKFRWFRISLSRVVSGEIIASALVNSVNAHVATVT